MSSFVDQLLGSLGGNAAEKLGAQLGIPADKTQQAMSMLTPVLLGGLKKQKENSSEEEVEQMIQQAGASEDHVDNIDQFLSNAPAEIADDNLGLGSILDPSQREQTTTAIAGKLGIDNGMTKKLITMLAPIILGMLMKQGRKDPQTQTRSGGIASILDRDGDGNILDDVAGIIFKGLGR